MRAVSWNVNSLRTRLERVHGFLERHSPDLLCLQETKTTDENFPRESFEEAGYQLAIHGQKTYNGVALISKLPLEDVQIGFPGDPIPEQARVISATVGGVRFINVYIVNGKEVGSDKFEIKLAWLDALIAWLKKDHDPAQPIMILGDFNIAPEDRDVHDPDAWRGKVHFSEPEHARLKEMQQWGLTDLYRLHEEAAEKYSWWDYRGMAFRFGKGLRIDLALGTAPVVECCSGAEIDRDERKQGSWEAKPSDHAPLIINLA